MFLFWLVSKGRFLLGIWMDINYDHQWLPWFYTLRFCALLGDIKKKALIAGVHSTIFRNDTPSINAFIFA